MGSAHHHPPTACNRKPRPLVLLLMLLVTARCSFAQSPPSNNNNGSSPYFTNANFNPSMAIVIVVLISAFFFIGFFSIYIRQCAGDRRDTGRSARGGAPARSRRHHGLDPDVLATFPTLVYSHVKSHKIGKGSLECAVCLSEFEDDETLRLLPQCSHVFHPDCIDAWLSAHVTCPVCRTNLESPGEEPVTGVAPTDSPQAPEIATEEPAEPALIHAQDQEEVVIQMDHGDEEGRKTEIDNLERFVNMKRARSRGRPAARFPRSHSTGHSLVLPGENLDRFTLRLPENIRKEIVQQAEMLQRSKSLVVFPSEGSSRRGYRGEGSTRGTRSTRMGRSDRWGSFLLRTLSTKVPNWGRRGGDADGSASASTRGGFFRRGDSMKGGGIFRRGDSIKGEGSARRFNSVIAPFDCYGGGAKSDGLEGRDDESQSSITALNRV